MKILILCTGNSCRSQMAEAILQALSPDIDILSAGTQPAVSVHPKAISVMKEIGIDLSGKQPKSVAKYLNQPFDYVITVCDSAKETCPVFSGKVAKRLHIGFDDPAEATGTTEEIYSIFRNVRNKILVDFFTFYMKELKPLSRL